MEVRASCTETEHRTVDEGPDDEQYTQHRRTKKRHNDMILKLASLITSEEQPLLKSSCSNEHII